MAAQVALRRQQAQEESEARELRLLYPGSGIGGETRSPQGSAVDPGVPAATGSTPTAPRFDVFGTENQKDGKLDKSFFRWRFCYPFALKNAKNTIIKLHEFNLQLDFIIFCKLSNIKWAYYIMAIGFYRTILF